MPLLEVENLTISVRSGTHSVPLLSDVSLHVDAGEAIGLVGESGSGKTITALSILRLESGGLNVDRGRITFDGVNLLSLEPRAMRRVRGRGISMVYQDPMSSLNPVLTIGKQISETMASHLDLDHKTIRKRGIDLLERVGIANPSKRIDVYPHQLSGGMRQRVMIAMAICCDPQILIADEPTTALDVTIQAQILELLRSIQTETSMGLIMITHDMGVAAATTDRTYVMYAGQVVESGATSRVLADPIMPYTTALMAAVPRVDDSPSDQLSAIEGLPPDPGNWPAGCHFSPRCRYARDICITQGPQLRPYRGPDRQTRCWGVEDPNGWVSSLQVAEPMGVRASARSRDLANGNPKTSSASLLEIVDVSVQFSLGRNLKRSKEIVRAVDGVTLRMEKGETLALVGESGSGKSTLARAVLQLERPSAGQIYFKSKDLATLDKNELRSTREHMQIIFQDSYASLNPRMTVAEIVAEPLLVRKRDDISDRVDTLLEQTGLSRKLSPRYPHQLSGGQRQRVSIARAMALSPELLIADEPVSSLDVSVQAQVINLLVELRDEFDVAYLFVSHDLSVVKHLADRTAVMYLGKIVEVADAESIYSRPMHPYTVALMSAVLAPTPAYSRPRIVLKGDIPSPSNVPSGCRFRTRCWRAEEICASQEPPLVEEQPGQWVACHFPVLAGDSGYTKEKEG